MSLQAKKLQVKIWQFQDLARSSVASQNIANQNMAISILLQIEYCKINVANQCCNLNLQVFL